MQTIKETKRLYFNKWIYKVCLTLGGISYVKRSSLKNLMNLKLSNFDNSWRYGQKRSAFANKDELIKITLFLEQCKEVHPHQTRAEGDTLSIFTNDMSFVEKLQKEFGDHITEFYQPKNDEIANFLINNKNKVVCTELPNGLYKYKTYFGSSDKIPSQIKSGFLGWAQNYDTKKIMMPRSTKEFLESSGGYSYGQYFYTSDSKMLSMALMFVSNYASKTEEYVLKTDVI